jgi:4-amino-4-deoxy-L-arabinose transferase-like glycosyltransferase
MPTNQTARSQEKSLAWSAVFRAVRLLIFGFIGWIWFMSANDSTWKAVSLAAVLAVAMLVGVPWYLMRAHAKEWRAAQDDRVDRRWRAALDAFAEKEQEQAKRTYSRRNFHARPQSQDR